MGLRTLVETDGFTIGLERGAVAFVGVVVVSIAIRATWRGRPHRGRDERAVPPIVSIAIVAAALLALEFADPNFVDRGLAIGLLALAAGPFIAALVLGRLRGASVAALAAAIPGAVVVARAAGEQNDQRWITPLVAVSTLVGGALVVDFDRRYARSGLGPVLIAITALAAYTTVPDTEAAVVIVGSTLPFVLTGTPWALARLGAGAYGVVGLLAWSAAVGGLGRSGAVVGAIACLGAMLVEPAVRRALGSRARRPRRPLSPTTLLMIGLHGAIVLAIARIAGVETSARRAGEIAIAVLGLGALGVGALLFRPSRPRTTSSDTPAGSPSGPSPDPRSDPPPIRWRAHESDLDSRRS